MRVQLETAICRDRNEIQMRSEDSTNLVRPVTSENFNLLR